MENAQDKSSTTVSRHPLIYTIDIPCQDEMEIIGALVFQYSAALYLRGIVSIVLRKQLVTLLSLYFKHGYNTETKAMAVDVFQIEKGSLNSMNLELKEKGYLVDDQVNKRIKHLNPELKDLLVFYTQTEEDSKKIVVTSFHMTL